MLKAIGATVLHWCYLSITRSYFLPYNWRLWGLRKAIPLIPHTLSYDVIPEDDDGR